MEVKPITVADEATFLTLCEAFYRSGATKRGYDRDSTLKTFQQIVSKHENLWGVFIIDAESGNYAGYAIITSYWCNEEAGNVLILDEIYVDTAFRHRGLGKKFMEWLENEFKGKAVSITLEVLSTNLAAKELYSKEGYYEDGFVILEKKL